VPELLGLAQQAAGSPEHHFTGLQMPVSLIMDDPITQALNGGGPLVQAKDAGLITFGSAPLHGGELLDAMTLSFPQFFGIPAPTRVERVTGHGDLHWGNLTTMPLTLLDWERWGLVPFGYDAGLLHASSLLVFGPF
jgi:hypothetical protein